MGWRSDQAWFDRTTLSDGVETILFGGRIEDGDVETFRALSIEYQDAVMPLAAIMV